VADEVEGVQVLADLLQQWFEQQPLGGKFGDDGLLALGRIPALEELVKAGVLGADGLGARRT
jgi:hypothetical protein